MIIHSEKKKDNCEKSKCHVISSFLRFIINVHIKLGINIVNLQK